MSWYIAAGKVIFQGAKTLIKYKAFEGIVGTVASAWLLDRLVQKPKEERARKGSKEETIDYLKKRIDELEKEIKKRS